MRLLALALLLSGCLSTAAPAKPLDRAEQRAAAAAWAAYEDARGDLECAPWAPMRIRIAVHPHEQLQDVCDASRIERLSGLPLTVRACSRIVQLHIVDAPRGLIHVSGTDDPAAIARLTTHEVLHGLRACDRRIQPPGGDGGHRDAELWGLIQRDAQERHGGWASR